MKRKKVTWSAADAIRKERADAESVRRWREKKARDEKQFETQGSPHVRSRRKR